jgi:hypothetical protein
MSALDADCREYFLVEQGASQPAARSAAAAAPLPRQININSNENQTPNANQLTRTGPRKDSPSKRMWRDLPVNGAKTIAAN